MRVNHYLLALCLTALIGTTAWAQPVPSREPSSTHIFPAGGRRGTTVSVRVGAECLPPGAHFHLLSRGATAPPQLGPRALGKYEPSPRRNPTDADGGERIAYAKEWQSQIAIAGDAPLGSLLWRVTCGFGGTQPRPFVIGDLPEWIESEPNSSPERAERLTLPVTVNGQIAGERDVDCYAVQVKAGEVVACDVLAARLGSPLEAAVEIRDMHGRRLSVQEVRVGGDPVVAFRAPADGVYTLCIAHLGFRGGPEYVYRLNLTTAPQTIFAFPPGGRAGESREVEFFALTGHVGESLRDSHSRLGETRPRALTGGDVLQSWKEAVTFPASAGSGNRFAVHGVPLEIGDSPEWIADGNSSAAQPQEITAPVTVSGRLLTSASEDVFLLLAKKDAAFTVSCRACPAASLACPIVAVEDAAGRPLAKTTLAEAAERRCRLDWKAPADGEYRLRVRDLRHGAGGGAEFIYRLTVRPAEPDFAITLAADYVNVVQNGRTELDGVVERSGGFGGPITLTASGLPEGVRVEPASLAPNQSSFKLVLSATEETRPTSAKVQIVGQATVAGQTLRRVAAFTPIGGRGGACAALPNDALHVTVQHRPVFRLNCNEAYQYAHRGTVHGYQVQVERLHGFSGPIVMQICDRQVQDLDGIEVVEQTIAPEAKEASALIYLPETMHANVQHHCRPYVQGYATFVDRWGQQQAILAVCEKRCMIRTMPAVVKLKVVDETLSLQPGGQAVCRLALERTTNFDEAMDVELVQPPAGLTAEKTRVEAGATHAELTLRAAAQFRGRTTSVRFRATGLRSNRVTVISEAEVRVDVR
jgi:hypothetical protein